MKRKWLSGLFSLFLFYIPTSTNAQVSHSVTVGPSGQFIFSPSELTVSVGDTVIWVWDSNNHTTTSDSTSGDEVWDSGIMNSGATFTHVFMTSGSYPYHCTPHQSLGMVGTITVDAVIGTDPISDALPGEYQLSQNYPNPFNPETSISYSVPQSSTIHLSVYDMAGREVAILINGSISSGKHTVRWNAVDFPSGVYFYTIRAQSYSETKKMVLLK